MAKALKKVVKAQKAAPKIVKAAPKKAEVKKSEPAPLKLKSRIQTAEGWKRERLAQKKGK
jgi:hypothetical protein